MKLFISARELEILRKAVYGLSPHEIAGELHLTKIEVQESLKRIMKSTQSREPLQALQNLAKNGFHLAD
jgi:DNA-binding NarL/FixJ family response regulator